MDEAEIMKEILKHVKGIYIIASVTLGVVCLHIIWDK